MPVLNFENFVLSVLHLITDYCPWHTLTSGKYSLCTFNSQAYCVPNCTKSLCFVVFVEIFEAIINITSYVLTHFCNASHLCGEFP